MKVTITYGDDTFAGRCLDFNDTTLRLSVDEVIPVGAEVALVIIDDIGDEVTIKGKVTRNDEQKGSKFIVVEGSS